MSADRLGVARSAYLDALLTGDAPGAEMVIREVIDIGLDEPTIDDEVIAPALRTVGDMWADGKLTVADEHLATEISIRVLALQREAFRVASRRSSERVMLAAVEGERHVVGLEMVGSLLAHAGYDVRYLGPDVPTDALAPIAERHEPVVFGFTVTMPDAAHLVELAVDEVRQGAPGCGILVGGPGVPPRLRPEASLQIARHAADAVESVDALIHRPTLN